MAAEQKDHVKLVIFNRFKYIPNISPFGIAIETFMRLANIKYEVEFAVPTSNKETGQIPYAIVNGSQVNDSQKIINQLSELFSVDLDQNLTPEERIIGHAFQRMMDEFTRWTYAYWRYVDQPELVMTPDIMDTPELFGIDPNDPDKVQKQVEGIKKLVEPKCHAQGIGRKPKDEIYKMGIADLRVLSLYLGEKPFMFGDKPSKFDCVLFGHLCQIVYLPLPTLPHKIFVENECKNFVKFCDRMKALAWPDWDELTQ